MKILSLCAAAFLFGGSVMAQSNLRIQGGVNLANVSVKNDGSVDDSKSLTSFQIGVVGDVHLASILYLQPGVIFTGKGSKFQSGSTSSATYYRQTINPFYVEVPVNLALKFPVTAGNSFFIGAGPYAAIGVAGKSKIDGKLAGIAFSRDKNIQFSNDDPTTSAEEGAGFGIMKRFDFGLNGTAGIESKSFVLSANYGYGLAKLQSGTNNSDNDKNKNRVFSVTLGFKF